MVIQTPLTDPIKLVYGCPIGLQRAQQPRDSLYKNTLILLLHSTLTMSDFGALLLRFDKIEVFDYLVQLNSQLSNRTSQDPEIDPTVALSQLTQLVEKFNVSSPSKTKNKSKDATETGETSQETDKLSLNIFKLVSRNLILVFASAPNKVYNFANGLLNHLVLTDNSELSSIGRIAVILLIDLFEAYPNSLNSLINFSATQIYKVLKKAPGVSSDLVYLLASVSKNALKSDIDEKFQAKLLKIVSKNISLVLVSYDTSVDGVPVDNESTSTVLLKRNYIMALKNILILSVSTNYEHLLELSTSSSSAGSKMKPEAIMAQQHLFQTSLLSTHERTFQYGFTNYSQEVRIATVDLLANLLNSFIETGKFDTLEYLASEYVIPESNNWNESFTVALGGDDGPLFETRKEKNTLTAHDSEGNIDSSTSLLLLQTGLVETMIFYIQLQKFQTSDYLSSNFGHILDLALARFSDLNDAENHVQNLQWNKVLQHWILLIDYLVKEGGSTCHEILTEYIYRKFDTDSVANGDTGTVQSIKTFSKDKKRESGIFSFKGQKGGLKLHKSKPTGKQISPFLNPYQAALLLHVIELLLPFGINFSSIAQVKNEEQGEQEKETKDGTITDEEENLHRENYFVRDLLLRLIVNNNAYTRNYALKTLLCYALNNEVEINQVIIKVFKLVNAEFNRLQNDKELGGISEDAISGYTSVRLINYSLALLALLKQTKSTLLQNSTIVRVLSFCTQNLKHNSGNNQEINLRGSSCWIILSSLVTFYNDSEFVKLNSSQFLVFWKSLLTSQFISSSIDTTTTDGQKREISGNLRLRNSSLVCLLNYLNSVELSPESLKQLQFLLSKSYNYLTYLESNLEAIGLVTNFSSQHFNESDYNPNLVNNIHYSNTIGNRQLAFDREMISLILYSKKVILLAFTKLATLLKNDINSNMVLFLMKVFGDSKTFSRLTVPEYAKEKSKSSKSKSSILQIGDFDGSGILVGEDYNYFFGITSKFSSKSANVDELLIKFPASFSNSKDNDLFYKDTFLDDIKPYHATSIESPLEHIVEPWFGAFERIIAETADHSINYDPTILLLQDYSLAYRYSPNLLASLVDISIELFQLVFPFLSLKVQFSLLEQLRNSLTSRIVDPCRYKALTVNISVAIHGVLNNLFKRKLPLDKDLVNVVLSILESIDLNKNEQLTLINADSVGLASSFLPRQQIADQISKQIGNIVQDTNPYKRGRLVLSLAKVHVYSSVGFGEILNVIFQLLKDPNPVVNHYTLQGVGILLSKNLGSHQLIGSLIDNLYDNFMNDDFGYGVQNKTLINLKLKHDSVGQTANLLKLAITALGPNLREWSKTSKLKIKHLIVAFSYGISSVTIKDYLETYTSLLKLLQELIIFDSQLIDGEVSFFTDLLNLVISKNIKIGLVVPSPTSINKDAIFPFNTSMELYESAYRCYVELLKIFGVKVLTKDTVRLLWISMNVRPCEPLKELIKLWLDSSVDLHWFMQLSSLFKLSSKKLVGPFIEVNYQQKLLPLQQRQKKKNNNRFDIKDEEIENIVSDDEDGDDKNEPITWEFKLFIYDLLNNLLESAFKSQQLTDFLKSRIPDIVKISFLGSTAPIGFIKLGGANLLDKALGLFGHLEDPLYPGVSIVEQQQAQIISALIPCFNPESDANVIVNAINVSSKFINLPRIKFYSKQRILKTLIYLLEEISSNKFLKFGFLEQMSEYGKKSIQLSILNCWAILKIDSDQEAVEPELLETLEKYSALLTSLWILVLKELSTLKYAETSSKELELYGNYWINFVSVLSLQLEKDEAAVKEFLGEDEINFFFILFSQCVESIIKNKNVSEILISLNRLVKNPQLVEILFNDEIYGEVIDLFDRLMLIDDDIEIKCELLEIVSSIFNTFLINHTEKLTESFDKMFELVRVTMLPLFSILPFLRTDFDPNNGTQQLALKHCDSAPNLVVLKMVFSKLVEMVNKFPDVVKADLYSCVLFVFARFYEYNNDLLISVILPHLKQITTDCKRFNVDLVKPFYNVIHKYYQIDATNNHSILTTMVLITSGDIRLDDADSRRFSEALLTLVGSPETAATGIQCIKSLVQYSAHSTEDMVIVKYILGAIIRVLAKEEKIYNIDVKVCFEILFLFSKANKENDGKSMSFYTILIPLLLRYDNSELSKIYLNEKLLFLIQQKPAVFKSVVNEALSSEQKQLTEELVKFKPNQRISVDQSNNGLEIQLKTFGA